MTDDRDDGTWGTGPLTPEQTAARYTPEAMAAGFEAMAEQGFEPARCALCLVPIPSHRVDCPAVLAYRRALDLSHRHRP